MTAQDFELEVFFDGACPLCSREMRFLQRLDGEKHRIRFTDIAAPGFDPKATGIEWDELMRAMHARLPDGSFVVGVEAFRRVYQSLGFGPLVWVSRAPLLRGLLDFAYAKFAKNRMRLTGRCSDACDVTYKSYDSPS